MSTEELLDLEEEILPLASEATATYDYLKQRGRKQAEHEGRTVIFFAGFGVLCRDELERRGL